MTAPTHANPELRGYRLEAGTTHALMIPGFMGTPSEFRPLAEDLANSGISARSILLPGFGPDVETLPQVRLEQWISAAADAWREERESARRSVLIGFSMGGAIATAVAEQAGAPDALILLAPHIRFADRRAIAIPLLKYLMREFNPFANADFSDPGVRAAFQEVAPDANLDDPEVQAMLRKQSAIPTAALHELGKAGRLADRAAPSISAPTLIIQGEDDTTTLPPYTRAFAKRFDGPVEIEMVPGGHQLVDPALSGYAATRDALVRHALGQEQQ